MLLSAIADRDSAGKIKRSLAISIDVTEQKRAEEALKIAKEELSRYSKDLELQVKKRTREINGHIWKIYSCCCLHEGSGRPLHTCQFKVRGIV